MLPGDDLLGITYCHSIDNDHRAREDDGGHGKAKSLRSAEIEHHFVPGRRLHREVGGIGAFEDAVDVTRCLSILVKKDRAVGD